MRNYILLTLAILAGVLAFLIAKSQLQKRYQELNLAGRKEKVLVPNRDLARGVTIQKSDLALRPMLVTYVPEQAMQAEDYRTILGLKLLASVKKGEPLQWKFFQMDQVIGSGSILARSIPENERALSIPVDTTTSVSSMIRPNDRVDIIGTFRFPAENGDTALDTITMTILQNVTVLACGQQLSASAADAHGSRGQAGYSTLTLSVTPAEAEMLVFSQQKGKLTFTLRGPRDVKTLENVQNVDFNYLKKNISVYTKQRQERAAEKSGSLR